MELIDLQNYCLKRETSESSNTKKLLIFGTKMSNDEKICIKKIHVLREYTFKINAGFAYES